MMFGYATDETPEFMPSALYYSHKLVERLALGSDGIVVQILHPLHDDIGHASQLFELALGEPELVVGERRIGPQCDDLLRRQLDRGGYGVR